MNLHFKTLIAILATVRPNRHDWTDIIIQAMADNNTPVSRSKVAGWGSSPTNRKYRAMTSDDFLDVLDAIYVWLHKNN